MSRPSMNPLPILFNAIQWIHCQAESFKEIVNPFPEATILLRVTSSILSFLKMFADGTRVYRQLFNLETDIRALQSDIDRLADWSSCSGNQNS